MDPSKKLPIEKKTDDSEIEEIKEEKCEDLSPSIQQQGESRDFAPPSDPLTPILESPEGHAIATASESDLVCRFVKNTGSQLPLKASEAHGSKTASSADNIASNFEIAGPSRVSQPEFQRSTSSSSDKEQSSVDYSDSSSIIFVSPLVSYIIEEVTSPDSDFTDSNFENPRTSNGSISSFQTSECTSRNLSPSDTDYVDSYVPDVGSGNASKSQLLSCEMHDINHPSLSENSHVAKPGPSRERRSPLVCCEIPDIITSSDSGIIDGGMADNADSSQLSQSSLVAGNDLTPCPSYSSVDNLNISIERPTTPLPPYEMQDPLERDYRYESELLLYRPRPLINSNVYDLDDLDYDNSFDYFANPRPPLEDRYNDNNRDRHIDVFYLLPRKVQERRVTNNGRTINFTNELAYQNRVASRRRARSENQELLDGTVNENIEVLEADSFRVPDPVPVVPVILPGPDEELERLRRQRRCAYIVAGVFCVTTVTLFFGYFIVRRFS